MQYCKKKCFSRKLILCVHYDTRFTLAKMREYCGYRENTFKSTINSDLLYIDDIEDMNNEKD